MAKLYVAGIGPGDPVYMTPQVRTALEESQVICGYGLYVEQIKALYPDKTYFTTSMRREVERCRLALEYAHSGKTTAMVCSGDAGIYGMAAPILELQRDYPAAEVEILPGITAALSGAAILGTPLGGDFCVISLSDLLTPWEVIARRLRAAGMGDFPVCIYNPASKTRVDHLRRACDILLEYKAPETVCGWVRNIGRDGQSCRIMPLSQLRDETLDMVTTVFVGASSTKHLEHWMLTPRGYAL